jgi:hypothetical protein
MITTQFRLNQDSFLFITVIFLLTQLKHLFSNSLNQHTTIQHKSLAGLSIIYIYKLCNDHHSNKLLDPNILNEDKLCSMAFASVYHVYSVITDTNLCGYVKQTYS